MTQVIRVLLADDHQMMREGIRVLLEREQDIQVIGEASNGRDAVRLAVQLGPDVAVMDVSMPMLNGIEATRQIRRDCPDVRVLVLTVHESEEYVARLLVAGASGYIIKKAAADDLNNAIRAVYRGEAFLYPSIAKVVIEDYVRRLGEGRGFRASDVLTNREREILQLIAEGYSSREIASMLHVSVKTVQNHRSKIMRKLDLHDRGDLIKYAIKQGIIHL